jgi:SprB repeat
MKRLLKQTFFCVFSFLVLSAPKIYACGFDYVGSCATAVRFTANNVPKDYFASTCAYGNALSSSIGTNLTTLQLTTATTVSWESCTNILQESAVFYRIYNDPLSKGGFLKSVLAQQQLVNSPPYRTRTFGANLNIDLLAGLLPNTTYTIELYYQLSVDADGNGTIDATKVNNNNGLYYATTFQTGNINVNSGFPLTISTQNALCKGAVNGSASAVATGGTAPYTYAWSNGATGASIMGLQAGNYSVTATDATNAKGIKSFSITEPAPINVVLTTTNPSCGMGNGAITSSASGGNSTYTFLWNNNATTANLTSLSATV